MTPYQTHRLPLGPETDLAVAIASALAAHPDIEKPHQDLHHEPQAQDAIALHAETGDVPRRGQDDQNPGPQTAEQVPDHISQRTAREQQDRHTLG